MNPDTERIVLWLTTDQKLVKRMKPHTTIDSSGSLTQAGARSLLLAFDGPNTYYPSGLPGPVHDEVALANVDWHWVRDEINDVPL